jgi:hypothetical protein
MSKIRSYSEGVRRVLETCGPWNHDSEFTLTETYTSAYHDAKHAASAAMVLLDKYPTLSAEEIAVFIELNS